MGGDDLASDDEYLFDANLVDTSNGRGTAISSDDENGSISGDDDDNNDGEALPSSLVSLIKKRKKGQENNNANASDDDELKSKKKRKRKEKVPTTSKGLLIQAGRGIAVDSADAQATFMNTIYSHAMKLAEGAAKPAENENDDDKNKDDEAVEEPETTPTTTASAASFSFEPHIYSPKTTPSSETLKFQHNNLDAFLKSGPLPSNKRLKNWKHPQSPMVLVVTLSARRSVELMKQLSSLKLPIAKLFAKHMSVEDQVELLKGVGGKSAAAASAGGGGMGRGGGKKTKCYSLAVGTPGRLLKLLRHERDEPNSGGVGALKLRHTEVVIIDCHEDSKGWTVCTLNDTSKELMEFMKEGLVPEMERRKGKIKLAMF